MPSDIAAEETKEWVKVSRAANQVTTITVSLVQGNLAAKWSETAERKIVDGKSRPMIKEAVKSARGWANEILDETRAALAELDAEDS